MLRRPFVGKELNGDEWNGELYQKGIQQARQINGLPN
jgi:hypothetical protein